MARFDRWNASTCNIINGRFYESEDFHIFGFGNLKRRASTIRNLTYCFYPLWEADRICPQFPCMSYEATKRVSGWQCVCGVRLRRPPVQPLQYRFKRPGCHPKTLTLFSNLSCPIPTQPLLHMLLTDLHHSPFSPFIFFHTLPSPHVHES